MARLRRMYARPLFVVVGIFGPLLALFRLFRPGFGTPPWLPLRLRIYAGGMNEAIRPGPENPSQAAGLPQLSVIVPTFNERDNVTTLFRRLEKTLTGIPFEAIFVDDNSPDGTWQVLRALSREDGRQPWIRRIGPSGLSRACIEAL